MAALKWLVSSTAWQTVQPDFYIRPLEEQDAFASWRWRNDPQIWTYTGAKPDRHVTVDMEVQWIRAALKDGSAKRFAICVSRTNQYIGNVQLTDIRDGEAQIHIFIGNRSYWGQGASTYATALVVEYAKTQLGLGRIYLYVDYRNQAAIRSYEKNGFSTVSTIEGRLRQELVLRT